VHTVDPATPRAGSLLLTITNGAQKWVDVVIENKDTRAILGQTGHLLTGDSTKVRLEINEHRGTFIKIVRWAPGFLGNGMGGGDIVFKVPTTGDVVIDLTVRD
jgi:hypothetical protein